MGPYHHHLSRFTTSWFSYVWVSSEPWLKVFWEKFDRIWRKLFCFWRRISIWDADPRQPLSSLQKKKIMFCSEVREASHCYALTIAPPCPSQWEGNQVPGLLLDFLGGGNLGLFRCVWESDSLEGSHFVLLLVGGVSESDSPEGMDRGLPRQTVRAPG